MRNHGRTTSTNANSFRRLEVITGGGRRRRWSLEEKARIVAESLDPRTSASAVARRYGLHASQLFTWRQRLAAPAACEGPGFVPHAVAQHRLGGLALLREAAQGHERPRLPLLGREVEDEGGRERGRLRAVRPVGVPLQRPEWPGGGLLLPAVERPAHGLP